MPTYLSLLRAINVGGNNKIKMAELKAMYESLSFKEVVTYIQSGNIIFKTSKKNGVLLEDLIAKAIKKTFGLEIEVIVRTPESFEWLVANNPFFIEDSEEQKKLFVFFLKSSPEAILVQTVMDKISDWPEQLHIVDNHVFLYAANGYGRTKLTNGFAEKQLKVSSTARNWKTVNGLLEKART